MLIEFTHFIVKLSRDNRIIYVLSHPPAFVKYPIFLWSQPVKKK